MNTNSQEQLVTSEDSRPTSAEQLEQLGIEVDVSPTITTLTYEQIYISGPTLEEALITFLGEALSRYEALRKWKAHSATE